MGDHEQTARNAERLIREAERIAHAKRISDWEESEYDIVPDPALCLLCITAPMYPVALILYTFVDSRLWLIFLWIAVMSTVFAFLIRLRYGALRP